MADLLGVGGGGDLAGPDGPHRLVRDHDLDDLVGGHSSEALVELAEAVRVVSAGVALVETFPHTQDRREAVSECPDDLVVDEGVVLVVVRAAFRMPDDDLLAPRSMSMGPEMSPA